MELRFHRRVQAGLDEVLDESYGVSSDLGDDFFAEFQIGLQKARDKPKFFHFDRSGLRRCNMERFPYHFLYDIRDDYIRVWVLRYNGRDPKLGLRRFNK